MQMFFESSVPILLIGLVASACLAVAYVNTRSRGSILGLVAVGVVVILGIALERYVETDREKIAETFDQLAAALRADGLAENTPDLVIPAVHATMAESATKSRALAAINLWLVEITGARYSKSSLKIEINRLTSPPSAEAQFVASISGHGRGHLEEYVAQHSYLIEFVVPLRYENDRWLIDDGLTWKLKRLGGNDIDPRNLGFDTGE